jgi:hypothetical protein
VILENYRTATMFSPAPQSPLIQPHIFKLYIPTTST